MKRTAIAILFPSLLAGAALAQEAGPPVGTRSPDAPATPEEDAAPRPFVERSLILVPKRAGALSLVDVHPYDSVADGIGYRYQHPDFPSVRIDLFVYPAGRMPRDQAVADGMKSLRASIDYAVQQGGYTDLAYGEDGAFDLRRVGPDGSLLPPGETPPADGEPDDSEVLDALAGAGEARDRRVGRRLALRLSIDGEPLDSRAYLFYDGLYLMKGRISASPQQLPGETFDRFADRAMADLVPAIVVRNTGGCAHRTIEVDAGDADASKQLMQLLMSAAAEDAHENCAPTLDTSVPAGFQGDVLVLDPAMWRSE